VTGSCGQDFSKSDQKKSGEKIERDSGSRIKEGLETEDRTPKVRQSALIEGNNKVAIEEPEIQWDSEGLKMG